MQRQGRSLCVRVGRVVEQLLGQRRLQSAWLSGAEPFCSSSSSSSMAAAGAGPGAGPGAGTRLHSVVSVRDGVNTFAVTTVTFSPPSDASGGAPSLGAAAQHAVQVGLLALRGALGVQRPPSAVVVLPSLELPRLAVAAVAEALARQLGPDCPLVGCSSRIRLPDERRAVAAAAATAAAATVRAPAGISAAAPLLHVTLAAAHLPDHEVHSVRCDTSSLPRLPYLAEALQGRRPPAFLLLSGSDLLAAGLLSRLENLFPGSCIGAGVAAQQLGRDRRLLVVGTKGGGGGGGGDGWAAAGGGGGGAAAAGRSGRLGAGSVGGGAAAPTATSAPKASGGQTEYDINGVDVLAGSMPPPLSSSEFEGHFQRMLLDRDGGATASTSSSSGGSGSGIAAGGRRRRLPGPTANGQRTAGETGGDGGGGAAGELSASASRVAADLSCGTGSAGADAAAVAEMEAVADASEGLQPPFVLVGEQVHAGGGALLVVYPRLPPRTAAPVAAAAAPAPPSGDRLGASSCDVFARVALGTDHFHHVSLYGQSLSAISPPPTGPEPATAQPPAPDNPFYWWPATVTLPGLTTAEDLAPEPEPSSTLDGDGDGDGDGAGPRVATPPSDSRRHRQQVSLHDGMTSRPPPTRTSPAAAAAAAASQLEARMKDEGEGAADGSAGEDVEEGEEEGAAAAALAALSADLTGLPVFPLEGVLLFPGQTIQLRIYEKRYRLLAKSCLQQGAAFGLCWRGMGATAVVRSYQAAEGGSGEVMVLLEGGVRFSYSADALAVLPASYGLNVANRAEYVLDEPPISEEDAAALVAAAHTVLDCVAGALEESTTPSVQQTARTFANALHFASSSGNTTSSSSTSSGSSGGGGAASSQPSSPAFPPSLSSPDAAAAAVAPPDPASSLAAATSAAVAAAAVRHPDRRGDPLTRRYQRPQPQHQSPRQQSDSDSDSSSETDSGSGFDSGSGAAVLAADLGEAKRALDPETASLLSLYLAPHIPVHLESLRREWFTTRSALWRLQQEAAWLRSSPRVCMAVASSVLRLPRDHPLRVMLGLSRVAQVEG